MSKKTNQKEIDITKLQQNDGYKNVKKNPLSEPNNAFIEEHISVVEAVASSIAGKGNLPAGIVFNDLVSWGVEGLMKAKASFKEDKGAQFKTYANFRVRGEMLDNLRKEWSTKSPGGYKAYQEKIQDRIAEVLEGALENAEKQEGESSKKVNDLLSGSAMVYMLSMEDLADSSMVDSVVDTSTTFEEDVDKEEDKNILWDEVDELEELEQQIVKLFYKIGKSQKDIAEELKLSRSKVCRMHNQILQKLKRRINRHFEPVT